MNLDLIVVIHIKVIDVDHYLFVCLWWNNIAKVVITQIVNIKIIVVISATYAECGTAKMSLASSTRWHTQKKYWITMRILVT